MASNKIASVVCVLVFAVPGVFAQNNLPHLAGQGSTKQLIVDGKPLLMLGGELGNSSSSTLEYMAPIWRRLAAQNLNTVVAPVYWELIEPVEGAFDFDVVDGLIAGAREHEMRLVILWFGSWKNSMSSYVPAWVKRDQKRFPRARLRDGSPVEILSPFYPTNASADAKAFEAFMKHLREIDGEEHTVVMVQVENEIGMIPEARDHSEQADAAFRSEVPRGLMDYLKKNRKLLHPALLEHWKSSNYASSGSWESVFGAGVETDELFMAWHFAQYVEEVTALGKAAYNLPMYVNAALIRPGRKPGEYPSAGPLPHLIDVWRAGAPSIDFLAPDVYFQNFVEWIGKYDVPGNPLFIPEAGYAGAPTSPANAFYAIGAHDAMGYSPFSIENLPDDDLMGSTYATLGSLAPLILEHQGGETIAGVRPPVSFDGTVDESPQPVEIGDYVLNVSFVDPWTPREEQRPETHGGLIIALDKETFLVAGVGLTITFSVRGAPDVVAGIEMVEEGSMVDGEWQRVRVMNGDQTHQGRHLRLPLGEISVQRLKLYQYK